MFTITGWRPGGQYHRKAATLSDALGYLEEAERQGFLGIKVRDATRRIYMVSEMRRARSLSQALERDEGSKQA